MRERASHQGPGLRAAGCGPCSHRSVKGAGHHGRELQNPGDSKRVTSFLVGHIRK